MDVSAFRIYCLATQDECLRLYPWYKLPIILHILLNHSPSIIKTLKVPIGLWTEEPLEAMHKILRSFRLNFARKRSRVAANEDVFVRCMINSDIYLSELRCVPSKKKRSVPEDMRQLLIIRDDDLDEIIIENDETGVLDLEFED